MITPWDAAKTADQAIDVLRPGPERDRHIDGLRAASARYTWSKSARSLLEIYEEAFRRPPRVTKKLKQQLDSYIEVYAHIDRLDDEKIELLDYIKQLEWRASAYDRLTPTDLSLIAGDGIPSGLRRPLLAVTHRRFLRKTLFLPIKLGYKVAKLFGGSGDKNGALDGVKSPDLLEQSTSERHD